MVPVQPSGERMWMQLRMTPMDAIRIKRSNRLPISILSGKLAADKVTQELINWEIEMEF
jgi:hypothetical protein